MKSALKSFFHLLALILTAPIGIFVRLLAPLDKRDLVFQFGSQLLSLLPGIPGDYLRRAYYFWVISAGKVSIGFGSILAQRDSQIMDRTYIGSFCNLGSCRVGRDVLIGSNVMIASPSMHFFDRLDTPISQQGGRIEVIKIGDGVWIGNGAIILNDVADGAIVAAGAVVTKPCQKLGIYGGNPARLIRYRGEGDKDSRDAEE